MILALILAQVVLPTPARITATPTPPPVSERGVLSKGLEDVAARAKALGATLGAVIVDTASGASASVNGDTALPMMSVQKLPIAVLVYRSIDAGTLRADQIVHVEPSDVVKSFSPIADSYAKRSDYTIREIVAFMLENSDNTAPNTLLRLLGGLDAANARLRELHYDDILLGADDHGFAKPLTLAAFLQDVQSGKLLSAASRSSILEMMSKAHTWENRLRAGFPKGTLVEEKTGSSDWSVTPVAATNDVAIVNVSGRTLIVVAMLHNARGDQAQREALLAAVGRVAYDVSRQFPL